MSLRFESSEISGLGLDCPGQCAYCCLCPPGLIENEAAALVEMCGDDEHSLTEDMIGDSEHAIGLQGGWGACAFLHGRLCRVYDLRPHFCRQYPVVVYSGWRLQLYALRSCRGLVEGKGRAKGRPLMSIIKDEVKALGKGYFLRTLRETKRSFEDLKGKDIYDPPKVVMEEAFKVASSIGNARAMNRLMGIGKGGKVDPRDLLLRTFWDDIEDTFSSKDIMDLPVYNTPDNVWRVFRTVGEEEVSGFSLKESGGLVYERSVPLASLGLRQLTRTGREVLRDYLELAFGRDIFYGMVARDSYVDGQRMREKAIELATRVATDLWWRTGLLSEFDQRGIGGGEGSKRSKRIGAKEAREGVVFMDADLLDSFALGAII